MPPLTNIFGSDSDEPFEPGSYLPLQPLDGEGEDDAGEPLSQPLPEPLLGPDDLPDDLTGEG